MLKRFLALTLIILIFTTVEMVTYASEIPAIDDSGEYYSKTVYIAPEDMIVPFSVEEQGKPIGQVIKTVYVKERFNEDGILLESRLMNKAEVDAYKEAVEERCQRSEQIQTFSSKSSELIGEDYTTEGELTITFTVYDLGDNEYRGCANAQWTNGIWILPDGEKRPGNGKDYLAITWGGNGELKRKSKSISGNYQFDQGKISFSQAKSDTYAGYCWQFNETKWKSLIRYYADSIDADVTIKKTYKTQKNKETSMKMTYIHTFDKLSGTVKFEVDKSGAASAGVTLTTVEDQWTVEVDIPGVMY